MLSSTSDVILDFLSRYMRWNLSYLHDIKQLESVCPKLHSCDFDSFVAGKHENQKQLLLYNGFMTLSCSSIDSNTLHDNIYSGVMSSLKTDNWDGLIMEAFYYFKLFFPAALFFYSNRFYEHSIQRARKVILNRYRLILTSTSPVLNQYDLCEGMSLKFKYIRGEISDREMYVFNLTNNCKLLKSNVTNGSSNSKEIVVMFEDIEHIATVVHKNYNFIIKNKPFLICRENTAFKRYKNVLKLKFQATVSAKNYICNIKIEKYVPLYFLFHKSKDLKALIHIHNDYVRSGINSAYQEIPLPKDEFKQHHVSVQSIDNFISHLSNVKTIQGRIVPSSSNASESPNQLLKRSLEKNGFISIYDLRDHKSLAYVKNRVIHVTATCKRPMPEKPFYQKNGKKLVKLEKKDRTLTMSRYKSVVCQNGLVSYNLNYQGSIGLLNLAIGRFLNENKAYGCQVVNNVYVSNVCTTSDTIHFGIQNSHVYRTNCLNNEGRFSYQMLNFPAMVTLLNNSSQEKANPIINNRTSLNTCRMFGDELKNALMKYIDFLQIHSEIDNTLVNLIYRVEKIYHEMLPRNVLLLIHLLYIFKGEHGYNDDAIVAFFRDRTICSRIITASNRSFSLSNIYNKRYKSDAIDNTSKKSISHSGTKPPTIRRDHIFKKYKKVFKDIGSTNNSIYKFRGRNASLLDLILNSKDNFFFHKKCSNLLKILLKKYSHFSNATLSLEKLFILSSV